MAKCLLPLLLAVVVSACTSIAEQQNQDHQQPDSRSIGAAPRPLAADDLMYTLLVAEMAGREGQLETALVHYLAAAQMSDDPRIAERATRIAIYARVNEQALSAAQRWSQLDPDNIEVHQVLASLFIRLGNVEASVAEVQEILHRLPSATAEGITMVATLLEREADQQTSFAVLRKVAALYPDLAVAHYVEASFAYRLGQDEHALKAVQTALHLDPSHRDSLLLGARILSELGRSDEAFDSLNRALVKDPQNLNLRLGYAQLLVDAGQYETAAAELRKLYKSHKNNTSLVYSLGLLAIESRRLEDGRKYMEQVLKLGGKHDDASYYLGRIADNQRQYLKALQHYRQVRSGENLLDAQVRSSEMLATLGEVDQAREYLNKLRMIYPEPSYAIRFFLSEAKMLRQARLYQQSVDLLTAALQQHPGDSQLLYARALAAERLDLPEIFETDLRAVLAKEPENPQALNALGYFLVDRTSRLDEAEGYLLKALQLMPDDAAVIDSVGWLYYRRGNLAKALGYLQKAYGRHPDPEIAAHLGEVLWVSGDKEAADKIWNQALQIAPQDTVLLKAIQRLKQ